MLDYTQTFDEFSRSVKPVDLALYAGIGLVLWVWFKDKISGSQPFLQNLLDSIKNILGNTKTNIIKPTLASPERNDTFFDLVTSWKQTRDLAVKSGCKEAVKVADQMFPFLSPTVCSEEKI